jgi:hypothetical protein
MIKLFFKSKKTKVGFKGILVFSLLFSFVIFWFCEGLFGDLKKILLKKIINTCNIRLPKSSICDGVGRDKSFFFSGVARTYNGDLVGLEWSFFFFPLSFLSNTLEFTPTLLKKNICVLQFVFIWIFVIILFVTIYFALMLFEI